MKIRLTLLTLLLLAAVQFVAAQSLDVSGSVRDSEGHPVIGATVSVKGGKTVAITDVNGKFTAKGLNNSDVLVISYLGMEDQEVKARKNLNITMTDDNHELDEVMVVAFGKQKRSSFTGSAGIVGSKELEKKQVTNALSALNGEVAGVQLIDNSGDPASTPTIRIRGFSSLNAGNNPLIVLDGSPYEGGINNINPSDIESVTVLKDAASNALYGARGANGVIMITTKGAKRSGTGKTTINFDAKWGANTNAAKDYETIDNPGQYYEMYYKALKNAEVKKGSSLYDAHILANEALYKKGTENGALGYIVYAVPDGEYLIGENGRLNPHATLGNRIYNNGQFYTLVPDDWTDEAFRTALRQEYNVNVSSSLKNAQLYASLGYLNNEGIVDNTGYERYTARLKADWQANKWLSMGGNISFAHSTYNAVDDDSSTSLFYILKQMAPIYPVYIRDAAGNIMTDSNGRMYDYGDGEVTGIIRQRIQTYNPLQEVMLDTNETIYNNVTLSGFADITPFEGLKITFNGTVTNNQSRNTYAYNPYYGWHADTYPNGSVSKTQTQRYSVNFQQLVNYTKTFGKHNIALLLGHENYKYRYDYLFGQMKNMASFAGNQNLSGAITMESLTDYDSDNPTTDYNNEGWFFRAQYDYADKYFGSFSYRRDASSRFHPDHRWGNFFSVGGAWIINKEKWFNASWVDQLKLKASIGQQGNDNIGDYRYTDLYSITNNGGELGFAWQQKGNENITWETNTNFNIGADFSLFKSRLTGSVEYFYRHTTDMLSWVSAPFEAGYSGYYSNVGSMDNKGIEVNLNAVILRNKNLSWSVNMNATHYKNEVVELAADRKTLDVEGHGGYTASYYEFVGEGLPIYTWYTKKYAGVNSDGQALWYTSAGGTTTDYNNEAGTFLCGDAIPDLYGGFGTSFNAYGFDFSINFTYSLGGKMFDWMYFEMMNNPGIKNVGHSMHKDMLNAWSETNTSTNVPRIVYDEDASTYYSDRFLTNASYLSLQNINIGYTLPSKLTRKLGLSSIRIYGSADNICYWSKRKGFDPRGQFAVDSSSSTTAGRYTYSPVRSISGGINIQF